MSAYVIQDMQCANEAFGRDPPTKASGATLKENGFNAEKAGPALSLSRAFQSLGSNKPGDV